MHKAVDRGLLQVDIDPVEFLTGWYVPRDQTESFLDEVGIALELPAMRGIGSCDSVVVELFLTVSSSLVHLFLLLVEEVLIVPAFSHFFVTVIITAALVHELLGKDFSHSLFIGLLTEIYQFI